MFRCKYLQELNKKVFRSESVRISRGAVCQVFRCKYLQELNKKVFRSEAGYQEELSVGCSGVTL